MLIVTICILASLVQAAKTERLIIVGADRHPAEVIPLAQALDQIRGIIEKDGYPKDGITVIIEPGDYSYEQTLRFTTVTSGTEEAPITFKVKDGKKATFNGGLKLDTTTAQTVKDPSVLNRLAPIARGKVYQCKIDNHKHQKLLSINSAKLSFNGRMMNLARYPNLGYGHIDRIFDKGAIYAHGRTQGDPPAHSISHPIGGIFSILDKDITPWQTEFQINPKTVVIGYLSYDWYKESHKIASINDGKIKLQGYSRYGILNKEKIPRRIIVSNLLCELDSPGEFYFDDTSGMLFFWPFDPNVNEAELSLWGGKSFARIKNTSNVRFENFIIEGVSQDKAVIEIQDSHNIQLAGCTIRNSSRSAVTINGGSNCGLLACDIYDVPHHITLNGGDTKQLTPSGHYAINCHFTQVQATDFYGRIQLRGVGQIFKNNLVHNFIGQVMTVGSNDHRIEYNEFFNIGIEEGDGGTIYSGAAMWSWGNVYRRNFLHHLMCVPQAHPRGGIYPDDRDQGDTITENVFYKAAHRAILLNGGAGHTVTSNLFLDCHIGVYNTDNGAEKMYNMQADYDSGKLKRGDKMDYIWRTEQAIGKQGWDNEPWKTKYPLFTKIMNQEKRRFWPIECTVTDNCFARTMHGTQFLTKDADGKRLEVPFEKIDYITANNNKKIRMDVFNDLSTLDFTYRNTNLSGHLPDVQFGKIGLYKDAYRINPPDKTAYRKAVKEKFTRRRSYDPKATYNAKTINRQLYFNTGKLIMK